MLKIETVKIGNLKMSNNFLSNTSPSGKPAIGSPDVTLYHYCPYAGNSFKMYTRKNLTTCSKSANKP